MMKLKFIKSKSYATRLLCSYLVIIICLFMAMAVVVSFYFGMLKKDLNKFNEFVFTSVANSVNGVLSDINDLHINLTRNENLNKVIEEHSDRMRVQATYSLMEDFGSYRQMSETVDTFFFYLRDEDLVISQNGVLESYRFYKYYFASDKMSYEQWKKLFYDFKNDKYISLYAKNDAQEMTDYLGFMFKVPLDNPKAVGMILCDKQHFMKNIEEIEWKSLCDIYIYNDEGSLITHHKNSEGDIIAHDLKEIDMYENRDTTVLKKTVAIDKYYWHLIFVVSKQALNESIFLVQTVTAVVVAVSLILLIFLVKSLIKVNGRPLKSVLSLFGATDEKDEYAALHKFIKDTLEKNSNLMKNLKVRERELKTVAISKIIKGNLSPSALVEYNIEFQSENYAVISFYLENLSTLFRDDNMPNFERNYHLRYIIENVMEELFQEKGIQIYTTEIDGYIVCLANLEDYVTQSLLVTIAEKGTEHINRYFDIELRFAVSDIYREFSELSVAYAQTQEVLQYGGIAQNESNVLFSQLRQAKEGKYLFDTEAEERLIHFIKTNSRREALTAVSLIFDELRTVDKYPSDYIRYVALDVASTVTKCAENYFNAPGGGGLREIELYNCIRDTSNPLKMQEAITRYIDDICATSNYIVKKKKYSPENLREYIRENLTDVNLSAASIGMYFNLSTPYVAKLFKENEKDTLSDYISRKRIEKAQELIAMDKYSMREISQMVGFSNERTYYRALKKFGEN